MKKIFLSFGLLLTVGLATVVFNSCSDEKEKSGSSNQLLVGTWQAIKSEGMDGNVPVSDKLDYTLAFYENGKGKMSSNDEEFNRGSFEWEVQGDILFVVFAETNEEYDGNEANFKIIKLTSTEMILDAWYDSDDGSYYYTTYKKGEQNGLDKPDDIDDPNNPNTATYDTGVIINGKKWATRNVDAPGTFAAKPEDPGMFYQWNRKIGWSAADPAVNSDGGTTWDNTTPTGTTWEATNNVCPTGWRVPTHDEFNSLLHAGSGVWTTTPVEGKIYGSGNNTLFLPGAGQRDGGNGSLYDYGEGHYWTSTATCIGFASGGANTLSWPSKLSGLLVRCIAE